VTIDAEPPRLREDQSGTQVPWSSKAVRFWNARADERAAVVIERRSYTIFFGIDEFIGHCARLACNGGERNQIVRHTVVEYWPPDDHRAIDIVPHRVLHSDFAHFTSFMCVPV
jgi:hypothetical protein